jgi:hypothetical protein
MKLLPEHEIMFRYPPGTRAHCIVLKLVAEKRLTEEEFVIVYNALFDDYPSRIPPEAYKELEELRRETDVFLSKENPSDEDSDRLMRSVNLALEMVERELLDPSEDFEFDSE